MSTRLWGPFTLSIGVNVSISLFSMRIVSLVLSLTFSVNGPLDVICKDIVCDGTRSTKIKESVVISDLTW